MEGHPASEREATTLRPRRDVAGLLTQLVHQPRLADPRFSHQEDDLPVSLLGPREALLELPQLTCASNQRREAAVAPDVEAPAGRACADDLPRPDRGRLALDLQIRNGADVTVAGD